MHGARGARRPPTDPGRRPLPVGTGRDVQAGRQVGPVAVALRTARRARHPTVPPRGTTLPFASLLSNRV